MPHSHRVLLTPCSDSSEGSDPDPGASGSFRVSHLDAWMEELYSSVPGASGFLVSQKSFDSSIAA